MTGLLRHGATTRHGAITPADAPETSAQGMAYATAMAHQDALRRQADRERLARAARPPARGPRLLARFPTPSREGLLAAVLLLAAVGAGRQAARGMVVRESSMAPTLGNGDYILVDRLSYRFHAPRHGDLVVFRPPGGGPQDYVKRVIGLPGEQVSITRGAVSIDGHALREPYLRRPHTYSFGPVRVPKGALFVLGDNRDASYDGHAWRDARGRPAPFLAQSQIVGRVALAYGPPATVRLIAP